MHKEYIEADYNQLDFLKNNGLNFYSLQALFWNELLVPGQKGVVEADFPKFNVDGTSVKLTNGNMTYNWTTSNNGQIVMTNVNYATAKSGASSLLWMYSDFKALGTKQFPAHQNFQFSTTSNKQMKTVIVLKGARGEGQGAREYLVPTTTCCVIHYFISSLTFTTPSRHRGFRARADPAC